MFQRISFEQFIKSSKTGKISLLFIKERGCQYCQIAEEEMKKAGFPESISSINCYEVLIDDEPGLPSKLGLVGVPAFFKIDSAGKKRIKTGFGNIEDLNQFLDPDPRADA